MLRKTLFLVLSLFSAFYVKGVNFSDVKLNSGDLKEYIGCTSEVCRQKNKNNIPVVEFLLSKLGGYKYQDLVNLDFDFKKEKLIDLVSLYGSGTLSSYCEGLIRSFSGYVRVVTAVNAISADLYDNLLPEDLDNVNLPYIEYVLHDLGNKDYSVLVDMTLAAKVDALKLLLEFMAGKQEKVVADIIRYSGAEKGTDDVDSSGDFVGGVKEEKLTGLCNYMDYSGSFRGAKDDLMYLRDHFDATVGKDWIGSVLASPLNKVQQRLYPIENKYNEGDGAGDIVILENDYAKFVDYIPDNIKSVLVGIPQNDVAFFVKIDAGRGFYDKGRRYNMIFHGAMADWYAADMDAAGFNFAANGFAKNIPMGIFNYDGISDTGGDIAKNSLSALNVNAHNNLYSPDNAGFIIEDGRHLVTFWSVAKSDEKKKAVVTFHILFDWDNPIRKASYDVSLNGDIVVLGTLLDGLSSKGSVLPEGNDNQIADKNAWNIAIGFLKNMYGHC